MDSTYLGMPVRISELDRENAAFYRYCAEGELRLQQCADCSLKRYPPTTACPFCACESAIWTPVGGRGTVYSYGEVHHAIQPAFKAHTPYLLLLVELDEQRDTPAKFDGLRISGNLATADGELAPPELVAATGIGTRVQLVFKTINSEIAMPLWVIDDAAEQPKAPWRYSEP